ncbi:MAG: rhodanese-like domain-containing protein [Acidobacteriota bacterium]|nr:rhodanese-like domain-containing protein [Acidobacteriota bacterium]
MRTHSKLKIVFAVLPVLLLGLSIAAQSSAQAFSASADPGSALSIPLASQVTPEQLQHMLSGSVTAQPLVLQVGSHLMFEQSHIPYATYAGPGSTPDGLEALTLAVAPIPKSKLIVLYCGCCPWNHCPNIAPAYRRMLQLGFTNVKVLYIANNFGEDWVAKGYPTQTAK